MSYYGAVLCPVDPSVEIDLQATIAYLQKIEFLGTTCHEFRDTDERWSSGKRFPEFFQHQNQLLSVPTESKSDSFGRSVRKEGGACVMQIKATLGQIFVSTSPEIRQPRCPACGQAVEGDPVSLINAWWHDGNLKAQLEFMWWCSACGIAHKIWELDWSEFTGFHRYSIEIDHVFPDEYTIDDRLWIVLREASGVDWHPTWLRL